MLIFYGLLKVSRLVEYWIGPLAGLYPFSDWNLGNMSWTLTEPKMPISFFKMLDNKLTKKSAKLVEDVESEEYHYKKIASLTYWIVFSLLRKKLNL